MNFYGKDNDLFSYHDNASNCIIPDVTLKDARLISIAWLSTYIMSGTGYHKIIDTRRRVNETKIATYITIKVCF